MDRFPLISEKNLGPSWWNQLAEGACAPELLKLNHFLENEIKNQKIIYPPTETFFEALHLTSFEKVKVVILGQDPYHGPNQAHGLSFSVAKNQPLPPSLKNIFKELKNDLDIDPPPHGNLSDWARQGVLLLNGVLSVEKGKPASHANQGWETFTESIVKKLNDKKEHLVFILWGTEAKKHMKTLNSHRHLILSSAHPSPLSSYRGFFGSKPFSKTNHYLKSHELQEIDWSIR